MESEMSLKAFKFSVNAFVIGNKSIQSAIIGETEE